MIRKVLKCCVIGRAASCNPIQDWGQLLYRCCPFSSYLLRVNKYTHNRCNSHQCGAQCIHLILLFTVSNREESLWRWTNSFVKQLAHDWTRFNQADIQLYSYWPRKRPISSILRINCWHTPASLHWLPASTGYSLHLSYRAAFLFSAWLFYGIRFLSLG